MIVAIDGPAGSGKSTTAKAIADRVGYRHLDTGAMYRAVALALRRSGKEPVPGDVSEILPLLKLDLDFREGAARVWLNAEDVSDAIRDPVIGEWASRVAALPAVRRTMVAEQRRLAHEFLDAGVGVVLDGRDIGTYVFPEADLKVFMMADPHVRAQRRMRELAATGKDVSYDDVLREIQARDRLDAERSLAPLVQADDAVILDTTTMSISEQVDRVEALIRERTNHPAV